MRANKYTLAALAVALVVIFGLAGWGHLLRLDADALASVRTGAAVLAAAGLAMLGKLISKDANGDGIPDALQDQRAPEAEDTARHGRARK